MANFNAAEIDGFFRNGPQMALPANVRARLAQEGLTTVLDFEDFKEEQLDAAYKNMRTAIPGIPGVAAQMDAAGNKIAAAVPAIPAIPPVLVLAKCKLRLKVASTAYHYYILIGREPTAPNMNYTNVLKDFYIEYEAILQLAKGKKPDVPILHKNTTPLKWVDYFRDCLYRSYGVRKTPLLYVIRDSSQVPDELNDPLEAGKAYGASGSILDELISRLDHTDPLYKSGNALVYSMLEEATRSTIYASTVKPFTRTKDGRGAWLSMLSSHAGKEKWEQLFRDCSKFLMNTKWNGQTNSLEKFCSIHRSAFVQLKEAKEHVDANLQLPSEYSRVGYLIENIKNSDPGLQAAIANVWMNLNNMRNNFEDTVAFLIPLDPYEKHKKEQSKVTVSDAHALKNKSSTKTGVDLRWHKPEEYKLLTKEERMELYTWQTSKEGKAVIAKQEKEAGVSAKPSRNKKLKAKVATLQAEHKEVNKEPTLEELTTLVASAHSATSLLLAPPPQNILPPSLTTNPHVAAAIELRKILKRKRETESKDNE